MYFDFFTLTIFVDLRRQGSQNFSQTYLSSRIFGRIFQVKDDGLKMSSGRKRLIKHFKSKNLDRNISSRIRHTEVFGRGARYNALHGVAVRAHACDTA